MIRSGDMFYLIQLYVTYRIDIDSEEYWKTTFEEFLKLVPESEILSVKYTPKQIKHRIKVSITNYLNTDSSNKPRRSRLKSKKHESSKLRLKEAKKLFGEPTNTAFVEMQDFSTRKKSAKENQHQKEVKCTVFMMFVELLH